MKSKIKNIAVLTSSRADYGIYLPLLKKLKNDDRFSLRLIVFGTHLSPYHGMTIDNIRKDGFEVDYMINSMLLHDDENAIATAVSLTMLKFSDFWKEHKKSFDIVFCLGDRYEMFAAVYAGIPFNIKFAHLHGGETTLGAIDNTYRHAISLASTLHFTSTHENQQKVRELTNSDNIYFVGSLSLDNLAYFKLMDVQGMKNEFGVDFSISSVLITVHPETKSSEKNQDYAEVCKESFMRLCEKYQLVITMPNADSEGSVYRKVFYELKKTHPNNVVLIENFGSVGYFSAMKLSKFMIGNTSSGIIEAASFGKFVINLGSRQEGRIRSDNVLDCDFSNTQILKAIIEIEEKGVFKGRNVYDLGSAANKIAEIVAG